MANQSKNNDPRFWRKWRDSGAVETFDDAIARQLLNAGDLKIYAIVNHCAGPAEGCSTLSLGERMIGRPDWSETTPVLAVLAPGHDYELGQKLSRLPKGYKPLREVFG